MKDKYHKRINKKLKKYWEFDSLKDKQLEIIENLIDKKDVVGLLPTGYGKSMTYIIPPLIRKKTMFIISPLISLMEDQKEKLVEMKIPVATLHSNNHNKDKDIFDIIDEKIRIVYMSPEYLISGEGMHLAKVLVDEKKMGFLAVDESHCISQWGHDFRPHYHKLSKFRKSFPKIPILAVTATATETVVNDIINVLTLKQPLVVSASFDRPNLYIKCVDTKRAQLENFSKYVCPTGNNHKFDLSGKCILCKKNKKNLTYTAEELDIMNGNLTNYRKGKLNKMGDVDFMKPYLEKYIDDKIIIYTNSRKETMKIAETIETFMQDNYNENKEKKTFCMAYHAGMSKKVRESIQEKFSNDTFNVIVTTIAFGMGIDQTVRCVLILGAPSSIEEYYQQIGRAGRDGKPSEVVLFYQPQKLVLQDRMILNKTKNRFSDITKNKRSNLYLLKDFFETKSCRRKFILSYFGQKPKFFCCNNCDNCCEKELVNLTSKVYQVAITGIDMDLIYSDEDKMKLIESKLYTNKFNRMIESDELSFWKKMIRVNKFGSDKIPKKLAIMV